MNAENKKLAVKSAIFQMGLRFNQEPSKEKIEAYAKDLIDFTPEQIMFAFRQVINSGSAFFPSMAEILKYLKPVESNSQDIGNMIANELIDKILEYGRYKKGLEDALTPMARSVLQDNRYLFLEILDSEKHQVPAIRAQIRDLIKAKAENVKAKNYNAKLDSIGIDTSNVLKLDQKPRFQTVDYSGFLPEGDPA